MWNRVIPKRHAFIWVVSGPSGSGKTTLCSRLFNNKKINIVRSVSCTMRPQRKNEKNYRDYIFVSREEFLKKIKQKEFIEYKEVFGNLYGTPKKLIVELLRKNKDVLLCIDVKGALEIKNKFAKKAILIFVLPPSPGVLMKRAVGRARESREEIKKRVAFAKTEIAFAKKYDNIIINDDLSQAQKALESIIVAKRLENVIRPIRKDS